MTENKIEIKEKPVEAKNKIQVKIPDDRFNKKGFKLWHSYKEYSLSNSKIIVSDSLGGCAVQHLYGWYNSENSEHIEELLKFAIKDLDKGVGLVTCQVGFVFFKSKLVEILNKTGFTFIEYINYQHDQGGKEIGRMYHLNVKK